jgi:hypothetical protein
MGKWRYVLFILALVGCEWSASSPALFTPRETASGTIGYKAGWALSGSELYGGGEYC